jgi:hypothetical protein
MKSFHLAFWASLTNATVWLASTNENGLIVAVAWLVFAFYIWTARDK